MRTKDLLWQVAVVFAGFLLCGEVFADNCNGRWTNVNQSAETIDLGSGHTLTIFAERGSATSENSAMTGVGECGGYVLTTPDGNSRLGYACARKTKNGDSWSDYGGMEPGADHGTWTLSGGTGAFAGKHNAGTWKVVVQDGKVTTGTWTGNCN